MVRRRVLTILEMQPIVRPEHRLIFNSDSNRHILMDQDDEVNSF